jgi:NAD(P)-dependent dehydrogenase (short-subunit alcohol dehydrogenase family)
MSANALVPAVVREAWGGIDAVVNNASLFEYDDLASYTVPPTCTAAWRANTTPAMLLARALQAALLAAPDDAPGLRW